MCWTSCIFIPTRTTQRLFNNYAFRLCIFRTFRTIESVECQVEIAPEKQDENYDLLNKLSDTAIVVDHDELLMVKE